MSILSAICIICGIHGENLTLNGLPMARCRSCGLLWRFPCEPVDYIHRETYTEDGKLSDRIENCKDRFRILSRHIDLNNICDVGCGEGAFLEVLRNRGIKNIVGIEPNRMAVKFAEQLSLPVFHGSIANLQQLAQNLPWRIKTVTLFHVIEHLENPAESLAVIAKVLPPGGFLIIETPSTEGYSLKKTNFKHKLVYPEHLFYFNQSNLKKLIEKRGFFVVASSKRDFNQYNFSAREILFRLGANHREERNAAFPGVFNSAQSKSVAGASESLLRKVKSITSKIFSRAMSPLIVAMGRLDYIWLIAKRRAS